MGIQITPLIAKQLYAMGLMLACGLAAGLAWAVVRRICVRLGRHRLTGALVQILGLALIGQGVSMFLYHASCGKVTGPAVLCFFGGLWSWNRIFDTKDERGIYGQKGEPPADLRDEPQSAGHQHGAGGKAKEKKRKRAAG